MVRVLLAASFSILQVPLCSISRAWYREPAGSAITISLPGSRPMRVIGLFTSMIIPLCGLARNLIEASARVFIMIPYQKVQSRHLLSHRRTAGNRSLRRYVPGRRVLTVGGGDE